MKKILFLLAIVLSYSCSNNKYTIVQTVDGQTESHDVEYESDVDAILNVYCGVVLDTHKRAFLEKCIHNKDTISKFDANNIQIIKNGRNIMWDDFDNRDSILQLNENEILGHLEFEYKKMIENLRNRPNVVEKLKPLHTFNYDEFTNTTWVRPKGLQRGNAYNGIYCYFSIKDGKPDNFRLHINYFGDDWLFIKKYRFLLDGEVYEYKPKNVERDNNSDIWEWSDEYISSSDKDFIEKLSNQQELKIRYIGSTYYDDVKINSKYIKYIKQTFELYEAMGGEFRFVLNRKLHNKAEQ